MAKRNRKTEIAPKPEPGYDELLSGISDLLELRPPDVGPFGQQHLDRHLLGNRAADRRVRAGREGTGGVRGAAVTEPGRETSGQGTVEGFRNATSGKCGPSTLVGRFSRHRLGNSRRACGEDWQFRRNGFGRHRLPNLPRMRGLAPVARTLENGRHRLPNHHLPWSSGKPV